MNSFFLAEIFLALTILLLVFLFSMVWPPDSPWSPWWRTSKEVARRMCKLGDVTEKDVIYDLGSGDGTALRVAAREQGARGVGLEIDPFRVWTARLLNRLCGASGKIRIERQNFFKRDISEASVVFVYLIPRALMQLEEKMKNELKPGTRVISYIYRIPYLTLQKEDKENHIFVYRISPTSRGSRTGRSGS